MTVKTDTSAFEAGATFEDHPAKALSLPDLADITVPVDEATAGIQPIHTTLKDGETVVTLVPVFCVDKVPAELLNLMWQEINKEIERGDTYPQKDPYATLQEFIAYWFHSFVAILVSGHIERLEEVQDWSTRFLGTFYIKPNYIDRCRHVCNAGFVVNSAIRGKGIGGTLGELYLKWAPRLGYTYSVFNLVFVTNVASVRIWDRLGFDRIGYLKGVGRLKGYARPVDAIMFGKELVDENGKPLHQ
jgi:RimJ/RimL family protein N-acetyltransferase